jgi:hypothetical protein
MYVLISLNVLFIEHESAIKNYMKLPKRKENDRQRTIQKDETLSRNSLKIPKRKPGSLT